MNSTLHWVSLALASASGLVALWILGPGQPWWRRKPIETRLRWVLNGQLVLLASAIVLAFILPPLTLLVILLLWVARLTGKELRLELNHRRIGRALDELESSGEVDPQAMKEMREVIDRIHRIADGCREL